MTTTPTPRRVVLNIETDGLRKDAEHVWNCVCMDEDSGEVTRFSGINMRDDLTEYMSYADSIITFNGIHFDVPILRDLVGIDLTPLLNLDLLIYSRMRYGMLRNHSLDSWCDRMKIKKRTQVDFTKPSADLLDYCEENTRATADLYHRFKKEHDFNIGAYYMELDAAKMCNEIHEVGMPFDAANAKEMMTEAEMRIAEIDYELRKVFPPIQRVKEVRTVGTTKTGRPTRVALPKDFPEALVVPGSQYAVTYIQEFNPGSNRQILERLKAKGVSFKDWEKTDGHIKKARQSRFGDGPAVSDDMKEWGFKVNEGNLDKAGIPEADILLERRILATRANTLGQWLDAYDPVTGRVNGTLKSIGTWTMRMAHTEPNMGNIAAEKSMKFTKPQHVAIVKDMGRRMRAMWRAPTADTVMVGSDADGIQLRILAHLLNDDAFTKAVLSGDPHTHNWDALGRDICKTRDHAKRFVYAFLLGAGNAKVAEILDCTLDQAKTAVKNFYAQMPELLRLKAEPMGRRDPGMITGAGLVYGVDGRTCQVPSTHHRLAFLLQCYEATIMKTAVLYAKHWAHVKNNLRCELVNIVHDESLWVCHRADAEALGKILEQSYAHATKKLLLRCPITGGYDIGPDWSKVH